MYDFEAAMVEWGASPKKKKAPPKKAAPKPKAAKRAPPPKTKKAPKPPKRAPAPKRVSAPKKTKAPKKAKPVKARPPAAGRKPPPKKKAPARPKAARKAPPPKRAAPARPKAAPRPSVPRAVARGVLASSGSASLALVPTTLRASAPEPEQDYGPEPEEMAPEEEIPSDEEMSPEEEMGPGDEESPEDESEDYSEDSEESDSFDDSEEDEMELGTLQITEAVESQPEVSTARLAESIRQTAAPILRHKGPISLSSAEVSRRASKAIDHACTCAGKRPEDVRRKLNHRFMRRGYPPGTSDRLLAGVHVANEIASDIADLQARKSGPAMQKLVSMMQTLPNEHPTKLRVIRLLLTAKVLP